MKLQSRTYWGSCSVQHLTGNLTKVKWFGTEVGYSIVNLYAAGDDWTDYHRATWTYLKRIIRSARFFALTMRYIKSLRRFGKWTVFYIVLLLCWLKGVCYRVSILDCVQNRPKTFRLGFDYHQYTLPETNVVLAFHHFPSSLNSCRKGGRWVGFIRPQPGQYVNGIVLVRTTTKPKATAWPRAIRSRTQGVLPRHMRSRWGPAWELLGNCASSIWSFLGWTKCGERDGEIIILILMNHRIKPWGEWLFLKASWV